MHLIQHKMMSCGTILTLRSDLKESVNMECEMGCASEEECA